MKALNQISKCGTDDENGTEYEQHHDQKHYSAVIFPFSTSRFVFVCLIVISRGYYATGQLLDG